MQLSCLLVVVLVAPHVEARTRVAGPFFYRFDDGGSGPVVAEPGAGWLRAETLVEIPPAGGRSLWVCAQLPGDEAADPTLHVPRVYLEFDVYVNGERVGGDHDRDAGGRAWHMVPLPSDHARRWLSMHVVSDFSKTGIRGDLYVGSRADHLHAIVVHDVPRSAIIVILYAVGLVALLLAARRERRAFLGFAAWALCVGTWTMFYTGVRDLLLPYPRLWVLGWGLSLAWVVPSFLLFFNASFRSGERWLGWALWGSLASAAVSTVVLLSRLPLWISNSVLATHRVLVAVVFVAVVIALVKRIREGNRDAAVLAVGMGCYAVAGLRDVLVSLAVSNSFEVLSPWGMLLFVAAGGMVLQRRLRALRVRAARDAARVALHAREREMMLRDMHDGLGRITTSISLLTEVARRDPTREGALDNISSLAREGSEEIRVFMRGLDDEDRDWGGLELAIRERASELVEALGGAYNVTIAIADDAPAPTPYLYVHLLRVFQEGLTNALKYADVPNVDVALEVASHGVQLVLHNDGVRPEQTAPEGVSLGAGLVNMQKRVAELAGVLELNVDRERSQATLELHIPLPLRYAEHNP